MSQFLYQHIFLKASNDFRTLFREASKKSYFLNDRVIKGGGGKGPAITKKITFHELFTNLLKYGHITLKFIQKLGVEKKFQHPFPALL